MDRTAVLLLAGALSCWSCSDREQALPPIRESVGTLYVGAPATVVRTQPNASAREVARYKTGEAVSILSTRGEWAEVRLGGEGSGWVLKSELTTSQQESAAEEASETVRFRNAPSPVYRAGGTHGEIVLEASVDMAGRVIAVKTLRNSTGSKALEAQNLRELNKASFYPLKVAGRVKPFFYEYRITY